MGAFSWIYDHRRSDSLAAAMRLRRFAFFRSLVASLPRPLRILDVGGSPRFWKRTGFLDEPQVHVVLLNLIEQVTDHPALSSIVGDARSMTMFTDGEFDVVFSNSVIEHLRNFAGQQRMANEVRRVGQRYFVQTPNRNFPLEPHFLVPGFQFFPFALQVALIRKFNLGWHKRQPAIEDALNIITEHRLLTRRELQILFPEARIYRERVLGLTKSFIVYAGWSDNDTLRRSFVI